MKIDKLIIALNTSLRGPTDGKNQPNDLFDF
jgi:hypothetical protein